MPRDVMSELFLWGYVFCTGYNDDMFAKQIVLSCLVLAAGVPTASGAPSARLVAALPAARAVQVRDVHGLAVRPLDAPGRAATVLIFIARDCPISNSYAPEIKRLRADYALSPIAFYVVYVDGGPAKDVLAHARAHGYDEFALRDPAHTLVRLTGATVTPEAVVFGPDAHVLYEGRIDDRFAAFGRERDLASVRDLRLALDAIRAGRRCRSRAPRPSAATSRPVEAHASASVPGVPAAPPGRGPRRRAVRGTPRRPRRDLGEGRRAPRVPFLRRVPPPRRAGPVLPAGVHGRPEARARMAAGDGEPLHAALAAGAVLPPLRPPSPPVPGPGRPVPAVGRRRDAAREPRRGATPALLRPPLAARQARPGGDAAPAHALPGETDQPLPRLRPAPRPVRRPVAPCHGLPSGQRPGSTPRHAVRRRHRAGPPRWRPRVARSAVAAPGRRPRPERRPAARWSIGSGRWTLCMASASTPARRVRPRFTDPLPARRPNRKHSTHNRLLLAPRPPQLSPSWLALGARTSCCGLTKKPPSPTRTLPVAVRLLRVTPHAHPVCRTLRVSAAPPAGPVLTLLQINDWNADWQDTSTPTRRPCPPAPA